MCRRQGWVLPVGFYTSIESILTYWTHFPLISAFFYGKLVAKYIYGGATYGSDGHSWCLHTEWSSPLSIPWPATYIERIAAPVAFLRRVLLFLCVDREHVLMHDS